MIKNYLKITWRSLLKNKTFSLINVMGLAIGLTACFMIFQYIKFEVSYDKFHENSERIYRVPISYSGSFSSIVPTAVNHPATGPALKADFPEVEDYARLVRTSLFINNTQLSNDTNQDNTKSFIEEKMYIADASFLRIFSFPMVEGDPMSALEAPNSIVITEKIADKYFGNESALGKELTFNKSQKLKITGVLKNVPQNSHLQFDILLSFSTLGMGNDVWTWPEFYNYILLRKGTDPDVVRAKFPALIEKYLSDIQDENNFKTHFHLQPIEDIHLKSNLAMEQSSNGSQKVVYFLSIIAVFILIIAWVNYINLSTAKSLERSKEVGLRKVVGANRKQLIIQFFFDAFIVSLISIIVALLIILFLWKPFEHLVALDLPNPFNFNSVGTFQGWLFLLLLFLSSSLIIGIFPAFLLSSFNPSKVLKGKFYKSQSGITLRKSLVSFQYILSILLIGGSITIYKQLSYMRNQELGYNKDQILIIRGPAVYDQNLNASSKFLKNELQQLSLINQVAASNEVPGEQIKERNHVRKITDDEKSGLVSYQMAIDEDFIKTYELKISAGRSFNENDTVNSVDFVSRKSDNPVKVMINKQLCDQLGFANADEAIQQKVYVRHGNGEGVGEIIGVLENYHQVSLKEKIGPILYYYPNHYNWKYFSINVSPQNIKQTISTVQNKFGEAFPNNTFNFFFLDEHFDSQYRADVQFGRVFGVFTIFALIVASLGLIGLSLFTVLQHIKEVGVRKVLGASTYIILYIFSRDFMKLLILSYLIGAPIIYFTSTYWLKNFTFHTHIDWQIFVLPFLLLSAVTLVTVISISLKAALTNPVNVLRNE